MYIYVYFPISYLGNTDGTSVDHSLDPGAMIVQFQRWINIFV